MRRPLGIKHVSMLDIAQIHCSDPEHVLVAVWSRQELAESRAPILYVDHANKPMVTIVVERSDGLEDASSHAP